MHKLGDRVSRRANVYDETSPLLHGTVVRVYAYTSSLGYHYPELYDVQWDGRERIEKGFLPHGLSPEEQ